MRSTEKGSELFPRRPAMARSAAGVRPGRQRREEVSAHCAPAWASRATLSARQRVNQEGRQGFVRTWTSSWPLLRTSKPHSSFLPRRSAQHWNSMGIPCQSASSRMGRNPVLRSQTTRPSSRRRPWVPVGFSKEQQVKPNPGQG